MEVDGSNWLTTTVGNVRKELNLKLLLYYIIFKNYIFITFFKLLVFKFSFSF